MTDLQAFCLGIIEALTEFLPISSTGHMLIAQNLWGVEFDSTLTNVVQAAAILALLYVLRKYWLSMLQGLRGKDPEGLNLALKAFVALAPTAILGLALNDWVEATIYSPKNTMIALIIGGIIMILAEYLRKKYHWTQPAKNFQSLRYREALLIGLLQTLAMIPGLSRSMTTILAGYALGLTPKRAVLFSFTLGFATILGSTGYKISEAPSDALFTREIIIAALVAFLLSLRAAGCAFRLLVKHGLTIWGYYRVIFGILGILLIDSLTRS